METHDPTWQFEGFHSPNFTTVPDELFDDLVPRLSGAEVKVLLYIVRRTFGFKKERDNISISQMLDGIVKKNGERLDHGAGLSKPTLCRALTSLAEKKIIIATRQFDYNGGNLATCYQLNMGGTKASGTAPETAKEEPETVEEEEGADTSATLGKKMRQEGLSQNFTKGESQNLTKPLVKKRDIQETDNKKQEPNVNVADSGKAPPNPLHLLADVRTEQAHSDLIAEDILLALGDRQSMRFYRLVARKVPEPIIRKILSELKQGKVRDRPKVFTSEMMRYAKGRVDTELDSRNKILSEGRETLIARLTYE